ncbi:MAG: LysM peptidoglycan-binding domain-containing protein, partial [Myxococcota bacterium]|nr:LysM peptidoglycan-binding domain-containing protein [Myxococcota bacterium]
MQEPTMSRVLVTLLLLLGALAVPPAARAAEPFPKPAALEPAIEFWRRVFTEVDTNGGFIHDARHLGVVYEVVRHPEGRSARSRARHQERRKDHYRAILRRLAAGRRTGLSEEERVLALFPDGVSNARLREAATDVRFQLGQADKFRAGLRRMGRWEGFIRRTLAERGLPTELVALPHVESSFNPAARSHVGASGIWQFTRSTGRLFMRVDHVVDERNDPFLASVAAARLLAQNYERLGHWPLAITAYNPGAAGMARAVRRLGTTDIDVIVDRYRSRTFGFASRNFYVEFLAAMDIEEAPERWFGRVRKDPPENPEILVLDHYYPATSLARVFGITPQAMRAANPALRDPVWEGRKHVPKGYPLRVPRDPLRAAPDVVVASVPAGERFASQVPDRTHRVRRGESLSVIASRYGVSQSEIAALNGLRSRHRIYVGQVLRLPVRGGAARAAAPPPGGVYRGRRGDPVAALARRVGVGTRELVAANALRDPDRLSIGQSLR